MRQRPIEAATSLQIQQLETRPSASMISHFVNQSANAFRSCVKLANRRTGCESRLAGTATKISSAPMSIPAASGRSTGKFSSRLRRFLGMWTSF